MYRLRGTLLGPDGGREAELYVDGRACSSTAGARRARRWSTAASSCPGWSTPTATSGSGRTARCRSTRPPPRRETDRDAGTLLIRDCGSPVDTRPLQDRADLPRDHPGRSAPRRGPSATSRVSASSSTTRRCCPTRRASRPRAGDGWVKLVGDWIDREVGDLAPLWPDDVLVAAIDAAHAQGARVTAHVFGTDALPGLIDAGIDCIEHGTGLTDDLIDEMARRGTALVPTLINVENFPGIADGARRFPTYAAHMRELYAGARDVVRRAAEAGVPVYAGTDAGGGIRHGRIADEVAALHAAGVPDALGAASWRARAWLGRPAVEPGAPGGPDRLPRRPAQRPRCAAPPGAGAAARPPVPPLTTVRPIAQRPRCTRTRSCTPRPRRADRGGVHGPAAVCTRRRVRRARDGPRAPSPEATGPSGRAGRGTVSWVPRRPARWCSHRGWRRR